MIAAAPRPSSPTRARAARFISGAPDPRWSNEQLRALKRVKGSDFEVVAPAR